LNFRSRGLLSWAFFFLPNSDHSLPGSPYFLLLCFSLWEPCWPWCPLRFRNSFLPRAEILDFADVPVLRPCCFLMTRFAPPSPVSFFSPSFSRTPCFVRRHGRNRKILSFHSRPTSVGRAARTPFFFFRRYERVNFFAPFQPFPFSFAPASACLSGSARIPLPG